MRKNILSLSIAAMIGGLGFAGMASASILSGALANDSAPTATSLTWSNGGTGHILLVPYYSAQNGNATLLNLTNTDSKNGKEVKIRFRGASNSDDVLDFTVFLSPSDMWSAKISQSASGQAILSTGDQSCTLPTNLASANAGAGTLFSTIRLNQSLSAAQLANETREGYIEILNTADIPKLIQNGQSNVGSSGFITKNPLFSAIAHSGGVTACDALASTGGQVTAVGSTEFKRAISATGANTAATSSTELAASSFGEVYPTGGLFASSTIINIPSTLTYTQPANAVAATLAGVPASANLVHSPQLNSATIAALGGLWVDGAQVNPDFATADPILRATLITRSGAVADSTKAALAANYQDLPDLSTPYLPAAALAAVSGFTVAALSTANNAPLAQAFTLTTAIAAKTVMNEYETLSTINAATDWVFSMPTRRYSVGMDYTWSLTRFPATADGRIFSDLKPTATTATADTQATGAGQFFNQLNTAVAANGYQICTAGDAVGGFASYDREESAATSVITASPSANSQLLWCGEVSVIGLNQANTQTATSVLGASVAPSYVAMIGSEGWATLGVHGNLLTAAPTYNGLPVLGAMYVKAVNGAAATGVSGSYGMVAGHRFGQQ